MTAMDVSSIAALASNLQSARVRDEVGVTMQKKAIDLSASAAAQMIASIPAPPAVSELAANLGQNIDTTA
ncbi:hypothetical protein BH09PSE6_BH09PSE6_29910 [soil metagenome]